MSNISATKEALTVGPLNIQTIQNNKPLVVAPIVGKKRPKSNIFVS